MSGLERDGYLVIRPRTWPPPVPSVGDPILVAGFPGAWRRQVSWDILDFPGATMLALIQQVHDSEFVCQLDPAFVDRYTVGDNGDLSVKELPGMSGSPGLLVREEPILVQHLCGILKEGVAFEDENRLLYLARLDRIAIDGTIVM